MDLALANMYSNNISILFGNGDGTFQPKIDYLVGNNPCSINSPVSLNSETLINLFKS